MTNPFYRSEFWRALRQRALLRDGYRCVVPGCESASHLIVDHIQTRPAVPYATAADCLGNLRTLCAIHDASVKERANGQRRNGGRLRVKGCDASGNPVDPRHPWNAGAGS